jgi:Arabinose efflux permease
LSLKSGIPDEAAVGFRSERGPVLISVMLSTGLVAIDSTVLATAVPSIVGELGGFNQFPWLFSAYLLGQAVTTPIYAKLSDIFGRKPILLLGIALFLAGSILCALAWNMPTLIIFRAVQGLGAGAVQPTAMTIVGDIYTLAERARVQGYLASVWAISSVIGPLLGGVFSQLGIWRGVFLINIPLCLLAAWMFSRHFHEKVTHRHRTVDALGAALLACAMTAADPRNPRWRPDVGMVFRAEHQRLRRRAPHSWPSFSWSDGPPSRYCRCGSSPADCCARPPSSRSVSAPS